VYADRTDIITQGDKDVLTKWVDRVNSDPNEGVRSIAKKIVQVTHDAHVVAIESYQWSVQNSFSLQEDDINRLGGILWKLDWLFNLDEAKNIADIVYNKACLEFILDHLN